MTRESAAKATQVLIFVTLGLLVFAGLATRFGLDRPTLGAIMLGGLTLIVAALLAVHFTMGRGEPA